MTTYDVIFGFRGFYSRVSNILIFAKANNDNVQNHYFVFVENIDNFIKYEGCKGCNLFNTVRVRHLAYVAYIHTPTFIDVRMIWDMRTLTRTFSFSPMIF